MAVKKKNIKKNSKSSSKSKAVPLKKGKEASSEKVEPLRLKKKKTYSVKKEGASKADKDKGASQKKKGPTLSKRSKARKPSLKGTKAKNSKAKNSKTESVKAVPQKRTRAAAKGNKKPLPVIKAEPVPEIKKKLPQGKKKNSIEAERKEENASWKFFEKNGSVLIKIYTESEAIFSKLARIQGIQKSAKYFIKGRQVGADFIVPLDMAESACSIAGVKIPKITVRKPE